MNAVMEHYAMLGNDEDHDGYGPQLPVTILAPWTHEPELWGEPYVQRWPDGWHMWAIVKPGPNPEDRSKPAFRLPPSFWPDAPMLGQNDWRGYEHPLIVLPDGYVYLAEAFAEQYRRAMMEAV